MFFVWGDMIPRSYSARGVRGYQAQLTREDSFHLSTSPSPSPARREGGRVPTPKQPFYHHILLCGSLFLVNHAFQPQKLKEVLYNKCSDSPILNILAPPPTPSLSDSQRLAMHVTPSFFFCTTTHSSLWSLSSTSVSKHYKSMNIFVSIIAFHELGIFSFQKFLPPTSPLVLLFLTLRPRIGVVCWFWPSTLPVGFGVLLESSEPARAA